MVHYLNERGVSRSKEVGKERESERRRKKGERKIRKELFTSERERGVRERDRKQGESPTELPSKKEWFNRAQKSMAADRFLHIHNFFIITQTVKPNTENLKTHCAYSIEKRRSYFFSLTGSPSSSIVCT